MPVFFEQNLIDSWINEDAPLLDLTSQVMGLHHQASQMTFIARGNYIVAGSEEVMRVITNCQGQVTDYLPSGTSCHAGQAILHCTGPAHALLRAWKVSQNIFEFACGIATQTHALVTTVKHHNSKAAVLTTRKHAPGLRKLALKATLAGGAMPHRLGLSETVLIFPQHRALLGDWQNIQAALQARQGELAEKTVVIEVETLEQAKQAIQAGADALQFDKVPAAQLTEWVSQLRPLHPHLRFLAAGGIRLDNAVAYACSGVDALVTSSLYYAPPADIGVRIEKGDAQ
ncbi:ModD protein [Alcaligenes endophyticus]|uniref:Putative pyrophosphorylase ModD n=1 Tax=Alcaligenes endophyticus TaxID=1929088 RepID=A0ABT8EF05_9BURK|nr:ModD protein [Alcaligenes endophyticus]MCX5590465.1 ModD protein [Alcaligenes endophyticus]MDN4119871.1 ModD protein [Alcaligenes endophyticus]